MNAKTQIEVLLKIGTNDESLTKKDLFSKVFEMEQKLNIDFPECRVHASTKENHGLTEEEMSVVLEAGRYCLGAVFTEFAEEADLADDYLVAIREKLEKVTEV